MVGVHVTDVSNASGTMLVNLKTLDWDKPTSDTNYVLEGSIVIAGARRRPWLILRVGFILCQHSMDCLLHGAVMMHVGFALGSQDLQTSLTLLKP